MTPRRAIVCLALGQTIIWAGVYYLFPALLSRWEASEGWSKMTLTAAFSGAVLISGLLAPAMGRVIDRGRGPHMMAGGALAGAGLLLALALADNIIVFSAIWLALGVVMACSLYEPCFALVTRTTGSAARHYITRVTIIAGFAGTMSFPINHAIAEALGWQAAPVAFAALIALVGAPLLWAGASFLERQRPEPKAEAPDATTEGRSAVSAALHSPVFWALAISFALLGATHGVIIGHLLPIMDDRGVGTEMAVLAAAMFGPMQVLGRVLVMMVERRVTIHAIAFGCFVSIGLGTLCLYGAEAVPWLIVPFVILQGSGHGVTSIVRPVVLRELMGERSFGAISGAMATPYLIFAALAPFLGAVLWKVGGYDLALLTVFGFSVAGLLAFRLAVTRAQARTPTRV